MAAGMSGGGGLPELAPGRPMNWRSFGEVDSDSDEYSDSLSYVESDDGERVVDQEAKLARKKSIVDNTEEIRALKAEIEDLQSRLNQEFDAKQVLQNELDSSTFAIRELKSFVGMPLTFGVVDRSPVGPLAEIVDRDDLDKRSNIRMTAAGGSHSLLLTNEGDVYAWGRGSEGQLGTGDFQNYAQATKITTLSKIKMIAASDLASFAVSENNNVFAWGDNSIGTLGIGDQNTAAEPTLVPGLPDDCDIIQIAAGRRHTLFLTSHGEVWSCGAGGDFQNGQKKKDLRVPHKLPYMEDFWLKSVSAGNKASTMLVEGDGVDPSRREPADDEEYKVKVDFLGKRADVYVKRRDKYLNRAKADLNELHRGCERLRREIAGKDSEGEVVDSSKLIDRLDELIFSIKNHMEQTDPGNLGKVVHGQSATQQADNEESILDARLAQLKSQLERAEAAGDRALANDLVNTIASIENPHEESDDSARQLLAEYENVKEVTTKVLEMWRALQDTALTEIGKIRNSGGEGLDEEEEKEAEEDENAEEPAEIAGASVRDLLRKSNERLTQLTTKIKDDFEKQLALDPDDDVDPTCILANLVLESAENRRIMNDYTEGILMHTVRKLDDYRDRKGKKKGRSGGPLGGGGLSRILC